MASSMGPERAVTDGLVFYFDAANLKSYPGSGTTWTDLSPNMASASLLNGPVFRASGNGSIWLDATNDYIPTNITTTYQRFTTGLWMYAVASTSLGISQEVLSKRSFWAFQTNDWPFAISVYISSSNSITGSCSCFVNNGTSYSINEGVNGRSISGGSVIANAWNYIVASYDGSFLKLYLNGVLVASGSYSGTVATGNTYPWTFGRPNAWGPYGGTGYYYMTGSIAIGFLYDRALSDAEVFKNFESTRERFGV